jgi:hypothetical protein
MFTFIIVASVFYFVLTVIWETKSLNKLFKVTFGLMLIYSAALLAGHEGITVNNYAMENLLVTKMIAPYLIITALLSGWMGWIWSKKNWLNFAMKSMLIAMFIGSTFFAGIALHIVKLAA